ncbi:biotin-dependent carboxyltransferase family protein [Paenibacillus lemnae]|uniref:Biotin-dependent carboxyltransferase n=1 Tax=Paenibacillus lemnae TaxID=1330551 RepID=A0A848M803_PAELE|nr:biotin-dependent carboxyltransferase family protein [Paenibacillus lemnae]NMO96399.1 biotin-dependent carboxyltransferase [Paenibacillus lemnae]
MSIYVHKPGLLSTVQDGGRTGYQQYGVIVSGAMDHFAHQAANLLVGNTGDEATLEMTVIGPVLEFERAAVIAVCGADLSPSIGGKAVPLWRPVYIPAGAVLRFGSSRQGCRGYLAAAGGLNVPHQMNSRSTYLRAGIGGYQGRSLQAEDRLPVQQPTELGELIAGGIQARMEEGEPFGTVGWSVSYEMLPDYGKHPVIRILPGAQQSWFEEESLKDLHSAEFIVQPQSDRMGYRLAGKPLHKVKQQELLSEPVTFGTVQVPPDGNPIVLMADRQTTGGYPKVAQVITADLPLLAQSQIGSSIRFQPVTLQEAQEIQLMASLNLRFLRKSIRMYFV